VSILSTSASIGRLLPCRIHLEDSSSSLTRRILAIMTSFGLTSIAVGIYCWIQEVECDLSLKYALFFVLNGCIVSSEATLISFMKRSGYRDVATKAIPSCAFNLYVVSALTWICHILFASELYEGEPGGLFAYSFLLLYS